MELEQNKSLFHLNTFGIDVSAKYFTSIHSTEELLELSNHPVYKTNNLFILGGGSNILFTKNLDSLIVKNDISGIEIIHEDKSTIDIQIGAGENWHKLVLHCVNKGFGGIENLSLIPGNVGAAPMQNIGAYGVEIKDVFIYLNALHIPTLEVHHFKKDDCNFDYRDSIFKNKHRGEYIILNVALKLNKNPKTNTSYGDIEKKLIELKVDSPTIRDVSKAVISIRQSKLPDPTIIGNSGSFFKNPIIDIEHFNILKAKHPEIPHYKLTNNKIKLAAGWLIERAGWKGKTFNNYGVHKNQALVLVNYGGANGSDINNLSNEIIDDIFSKYKIPLEKEVNVL